MHKSSVAPSEAEVGRVVDAPVPVVDAFVGSSPSVDSLPEDVAVPPGLASSGPAPALVVAPKSGLPSSPGLCGGGQVPVPVLDFPLVSAGGLLASGSSGESGIFSDPLGRSASSGDWSAEVDKVEDGWTAVKGKKSRPSSHLPHMNLRSSKKGSKSKGKT